MRKFLLLCYFLGTIIAELYFLGLFVLGYPSTSRSKRSHIHSRSSFELEAKDISGSKCDSIKVRKEWRTLSYSEKASYIKSVKCLTQKPAKILGKSYRRWDDFQFVHCEKINEIHSTSIFLPCKSTLSTAVLWHRYFLYLYEKALREECELSGPIPYWDWTLDAKNFTRSPIWSPDPIVRTSE
ncbi:expressed protein [Phakopsora pachyrhizi]|uniref:Expressed protein n=1 Tax=Phakopsora pachyrhizi TaxID=170000 RepID=A0AAV0BSM7_PHAPC|nr:expressed protein [Phakopsora pachyrhizi]